MLNVIFIDGDVAIVPGIPKFFLKDDEFFRLVRTPELRVAFVERFGKNATVGRLGKNDRGVYRETSTVNINNPETSRGDLGFYASCTNAEFFVACKEEKPDPQLILMCEARAHAVIDMHRVLKEFKYYLHHKDTCVKELQKFREYLEHVCGERTVKKLEEMR